MEGKKRESASARLTGFNRAVPIILTAIAVFIGLCFFMQDTGTFGRFISNAFLGLFATGAYLIPVLLILHALFYASDLQQKRLLSRIIFSIVTVITFSALMHTIAHFKADLDFASFSAKEFFAGGLENSGGGVVGGAVAVFLASLFGKVGLIVIAALIFALYVTFFFSGTKAAISRFLLKTLNSLSAILSKKPKDGKDTSKKKVSSRERRRRKELTEKQELLLDDEFFAADNGMQELVINELGIRETRRKEDVERDPTLQNKVFHKSGVASDDTPKASGGDTQYRGFRDTEYDAPEEKVYTEVKKEYRDIIYEADDFSADKSADDVFGGDFDPFDVKLNQELMNKPSSHAKTKTEESEGIREFSEPVIRITEEDVEKARQRADFEMKKRAAMDAQRRYEAARAETESHRAYTEQREEEEIYSAPKEDVRAPYVPDYMREPEAEEPEEPTYEESYKSSFENAIYDYEREEKVEYSIVDDGDTYEKKDYIELNRTMLDPAPTYYEEAVEDEEKEESTEEVFDFDYSDDEDEDEAEVSKSVSEVFDFEDEDTVDEEYIPEDEQNDDVKGYRKMFSFLSDAPDEDEEETGESIESAEKPINEYEEEEAEEPEEEDPPFEPTATSKLFFERMQEKAKPKPQPKQEAIPSEKPDYSDYKFPPLDLLKKNKIEEDLNQEEEKNQNAEKLVDALAQFNVRISIKGIDRGPRITRYEIVPARGVKVQSVTNLFNDIALNLGAEGIRMEAPIPGKSAIGVEIPNKKPSTVLLRDLVERDEFIYSDSKTNSCLGKDVTGNPVFADIAKMPHVLVAGATGMGKSVCINAILISILYKARPDEVKFIMIDPKKVEFNGYNGIPHLLVPVVTDVKQAAGALMWAVEQMEKRYDLMEALEVRKIDAYNEKVRLDPSLGEPLPKIIIVIDELNDIMLQVRKPAEDLIMSIAQKARAAGIHLIIGTQRPSVDVITGVIKANIPSRISCKVASYNDSKTILEQAGAEKLLNNGDMLYIPSGAPKALRVQGAFVSDDEVNAIMKFLKSQAKGNIYDAQALEEINKAAQKCSKSKGGDDFDDDDDDGEDNVGVLNDQQFLDAVDLAVRSGKISTSLIQRKLSIGYGKAAKFIDIMEEMGIVSEPNGQRPRDVLITRDEWHETLARRSLD